MTLVSSCGKAMSKDSLRRFLGLLLLDHNHRCFGFDFGQAISLGDGCVDVDNLLPGSGIGDWVESFKLGDFGGDHKGRDTNDQKS